MKKLDYFFRPGSVAVVGASRNPKKIGHVMLRNFMEGGFSGKIYPINPNTDNILGLSCYPSVRKIPGRLDLAVISVPAPVVPKVLDECGRKGVPAVVIISGGFGEVGNTELERDCLKIIKRYRMRAIGPNCVGVFDPHSEVDTFFLPRYKLERPKEGSIAFISQSGALGSVVLDWMAMKGYKISKFVSYGNAIDVDEADLTEYLANDPATRVICCYFEGLRQGRKFYNTLKKVSKKKPVIILKGGMTQEGISAVSSHTGSLAGSREIHSAAFSQAGAIRAGSLEELFDYARVLTSQPAPAGPRVQIITDGGGFGVLATDWIIQNKLILARLEKKAVASLRKALPPHVVIKNPLDLTGDATVERYRLAIDAAIKDSNVDMIAVIALFQIPTLTADITDVISAAADRAGKPLIVIAAGGRFTEVLKKTLEDSGVPTFSYPERAAQALRALYESRQERRKNET
jgi:acetyl coenzyme A synthetase (ADP forming)-like protein